MTIYNAPLLRIDPNETKRYAGLGSTAFDEKLINDACREVQILSKVQGIWQIYDYDFISGEIYSTPPAYIKGTKIKAHLNHAEKVILLSITIGDKVEKAITLHFKEGLYAYALLLDAAATTAVESAADAMEKTIRQYMSPRGYQMPPRFSPGYGDWDLRFQSEMLRLSQAEKIGLRRTDSDMLMPRKSVTAILGAVPAQSTCIIPTSKNCTACEKKDCLARKEFEHDPYI